MSTLGRGLDLALLLIPALGVEAVFDSSSSLVISSSSTIEVEDRSECDLIVSGGDVVFFAVEGSVEVSLLFELFDPVRPAVKFCKSSISSALKSKNM